MTAKGKMKAALVIFFALVAVGDCAFVCRDTEWKCDRTKCIPKKWMCDGDPDCSDGTDELMSNCAESEKPAKRECRATEFKCDNGNCIPNLWKCDGTDDCRDNSDEAECSATCSTGEFQCESSKQCISGRWRCDGTQDCRDGSDEVNCTITTTPVAPHMFRCGSGISIPKRWVCDGEIDCTDGTDEEECDAESLKSKNATAAPRPSICRDNEFRCGSYCIMMSWVCDGTKDCMNGEDEENCETCPPNKFQCADKKLCIPKFQRCNMHKNCQDGSDELDCPTLPPIPEVLACNLTTHFKCRSGKCIEQKYLCDGKNNCGGWDDESEEVCGVNECERNNGGCTQKCVDTRDGHYCQCDSGYRLVGKYTCEDINECEEIPGTCSQKCVNTIGGYHCTCLPGYKRDPGNYTRCKAAAGEAYLFFSHRYDIRSLRLRDRDMTSIITDAQGATALDYMFTSHEIVWSNNKENEIVRANLTTPEIREVLVKGDRVSADGLAIDWIHNHIYYTDTGNFKIQMLSWDAKWSKTVVNEKLGQPRAIVVSPFDGYIFWTDWGNEPKIERAGLDGAERTPIIKEPHVFWPNGITIDHSNDHIYWCDGKLNTISRASLNGSHIEVILFSPSFLRLPYSITVFEDRLYWTDWSQLALYSADKFTGEDIKNISAGHLLESPKVVHVFHEYRQPTGENVCEGHQCSHFCIRTIAGDPLCSCPDSLVLSTRNMLICVELDSEEAAPVDVIPSETTARTVEQITDSPKQEPKVTTVLPKKKIKVPQKEVKEDKSNEVYIPTRAEERKAPLNEEPHAGMILGVALGATVVMAVSVLGFVAWWKSRQGVIKRIRFHNPVYKKTTDEEMDGGGFVIGQEDLIYNPSNFHYTEEPEPCMRDDDNAPIIPKKDKLDD
ncbi:low-density lipoprotein receptor-like [Macrobrachium nipponense]|uniref:low-density lipoprotein receptor-like n=1 Tax=Macrobrachium nipponense TaxID=159736 RepID=UPI0030C84A9A